VTPMICNKGILNLFVLCVQSMTAMSAEDLIMSVKLVCAKTINVAAQTDYMMDQTNTYFHHS
jgi:hypothetical protein